MSIWCAVSTDENQPLPYTEGADATIWHFEADNMREVEYLLYFKIKDFVKCEKEIEAALRSFVIFEVKVFNIGEKSA